jgi:hypothetical protein
VTQSNPASVNQNSTNLSQASGLTPEMLAALRARSARRYPGFGVWPRR